jgi:NAD(P)-dependent dehydrogenase (short-subunit alcohol dehydrogenase family)
MSPDSPVVKTEVALAQTKIARVTGAGSVIGRDVSLGLSKAGNGVVLTGRRKDALDETKKSISGPSLAVAADIGDPQSVARLFAEIKKAFGRLDVLFNNAGSNAPAIPLDELKPEQWQAVVNANLSGAFYCTQEAFRLMKAQDPKGGRIINNGSISAHVPRPFSAPYTATKHGITGLTRATSLDGRIHNIACGQIDIGNAQTEMTAKMKTGVFQADGSTAVEPTMDVRHVVDAVVHMASLPLDVNVLFMTVMANQMPFVGRG